MTGLSVSERAHNMTGRVSRHGHMFVVDDPVKPPPEDSALAGDVTQEIKKANNWLKSVAASRPKDQRLSGAAADRLFAKLRREGWS